MKRHTAMTFFSLCLALTFTVTLAGKIANSQVASGCADRIHATGGGGDIMCTYRGADDNYCYYSCTCTGRLTACEDLYDEWGLEEYQAVFVRPARHAYFI
jgi:hypothetical protein